MYNNVKKCLILTQYILETGRESDMNNKSGRQFTGIKISININELDNKKNK